MNYYKDTLDTIKKDRDLLQKALLTYSTHSSVKNMETMTADKAGLVFQEIINADTIKQGNDPIDFTSDNQALDDNEIATAKQEALDEKE